MTSFIVRNIKALRLFHRLTQQEFAVSLGASEGLISMIESGDRQPTVKFIEALCEKFHVKPNDIYATDLIRVEQIIAKLDRTKAASDA